MSLRGTSDYNDANINKDKCEWTAEDLWVWGVCLPFVNTFLPSIHSFQFIEPPNNRSTVNSRELLNNCNRLIAQFVNVNFVALYYKHVGWTNRLHTQPQTNRLLIQDISF